MAEDRADETVRHFDVVAEGLQSQIQLVAEGHTMVRDEIRAFRSEVMAEFSELRSMAKFS